MNMTVCFTQTPIFIIIHIFVKDLVKEINARLYFSDVFDFYIISIGHVFNFGLGNTYLHAGNVSYFKNEIKGNSIVEFVGLRPKMYSFTVCDAFELIPRVSYPMDVRHKAVAKGVARTNIAIKHKCYV